MKKTYLLAVSGGVDSVVLLDMLAKKRPPNVRYVVVHIDHGIRPESAKDAAFVQQLSQKYGFDYQVRTLALGENASEDEARNARYTALFTLKEEVKAEAIVTAHHQDDVVETMLLNLSRGTGPRGLIGFQRAGILRPLIDRSKAELVTYAKKEKLEWREDSTNEDTRYLRNHIRTYWMPKLTQAKRKELIATRKKLIELYDDLDRSLDRSLVAVVSKGELVRDRFVVYPYLVQTELLLWWLKKHDLSIDRKTTYRLVTAMKTALPGKSIDIREGAQLLIGKKTIRLIVDNEVV